MYVLLSKWMASCCQCLLFCRPYIPIMSRANHKLILNAHLQLLITTRSWVLLLAKRICSSVKQFTECNPWLELPMNVIDLLPSMVSAYRLTRHQDDICLGTCLVLPAARDWTIFLPGVMCPTYIHIIKSICIKSMEVHLHRVTRLFASSFSLNSFFIFFEDLKSVI